MKCSCCQKFESRPRVKELTEKSKDKKKWAVVRWCIRIVLLAWSLFSHFNHTCIPEEE